MFGRVQNEILRELRESRVDDRRDREAFRQFTAEMTFQIRRNGEEHRAELSKSREEFSEEMRAQRQALLAILDRLPPPGATT